MYNEGSNLVIFSCITADLIIINYKIVWNNFIWLILMKLSLFILRFDIIANLCTFPLQHYFDSSLQITNENSERKHSVSVGAPDGPIDTYSLPQGSFFPAFIIAFGWYVITACMHISARRATYALICSRPLAWTDWILLFESQSFFSSEKALIFISHRAHKVVIKEMVFNLSTSSVIWFCESIKVFV